MDAIALLIPDSHGVYVPKVFAERFDLSLWNDVDPDDLAIIEQGPDHEGYWDAWNSILTNATYSHGGDQYQLYQDGDLWAICYDRLTNEEYKEFFGEERE